MMTLRRPATAFNKLQITTKLWLYKNTIIIITIIIIIINISSSSLQYIIKDTSSRSWHKVTSFTTVDVLMRLLV